MSADGSGRRPSFDALAEHVHALGDGRSGDGRTLEAVVDEFGDATVVGVGEPAHGIRDCHRVQRRVLQHLVEAHDVRAVALETNVSEAVAVDEYVTRGATGSAAALESLSMWVWQTEGMRDLLEWLHEFNRDRPLADRVRFYGVDVQRTTAPSKRVDAFLERADPAFRDANADALERLRTGVRPANRDAETESPADAVLDSRIERAAAAVDAIETRFETRRSEYVAATGERAYEDALSHVAQLRPAVDLARIAHEQGAGRAYGVRRDAAMAENVERVLDRDDHDAVAVVAANGHLRKGNDHHEGADGGGPLGYHLDDVYGEDYYALALEFGTGSVRTLDVREDDGGRAFPAQALADPPANSLPGVLSELAGTLAFLDLDAAADVPALADWLSTTDTHGFAPLFDEDRDAGLAGDWRIDYSWEMDGLCFVPEVSAAGLLQCATDVEN